MRVSVRCVRVRVSVRCECVCVCVVFMFFFSFKIQVSALKIEKCKWMKSAKVPLWLNFYNADQGNIKKKELLKHTFKFKTTLRCKRKF